MVIFEKGNGTISDKPGTWYAWVRQLFPEDFSDEAKVSEINAHNRRAHSGRPVVDIMCPVCGKSSFLSSADNKTAHGVKARGEVFPSVVCPFNCGFHAYVQLKGWDLGELDEIK